jgi:Ohr subfamily peroxiredoxin
MKTPLPPIAETISQGGRTGTVESVDNDFKLQLTAPAAGKQGLTPEHLFGAAWAACFHSAVVHCAKETNLVVQGSTVTARVQLQSAEEKPFEVELSVSLPGLAEDKARHVLALAHELCPYSRATRGRVTVKITLN